MRRIKGIGKALTFAVVFVLAFTGQSYGKSGKKAKQPFCLHGVFIAPGLSAWARDPGMCPSAEEERFFRLLYGDEQTTCRSRVIMTSTLDQEAMKNVPIEPGAIGPLLAYLLTFYNTTLTHLREQAIESMKDNDFDHTKLVFKRQMDPVKLEPLVGKFFTQQWE